MPRHSKNACTAPFISNTERKKLGWGTKRQRLSADNLLPFAHCYLCTQWAVAPQVSPSGHMYCKECIYSHLVTQTAALKRAKAAWKAQRAAKKAAAAAEEVAGRAASVQRFMDRELAPTANLVQRTVVSSTVVGEGAVAVAPTFASAEGGAASSGGGSSTAASAAAAAAATDSAAVQQYLTKGDVRDAAVKRAAVAAASFWVPDFAPEAAERDLVRPPACPPSPVTGAPLRAKDLTPAQFHVVDRDAEAAGGKGRYCCAVTRKAITHQPAVLLRTSGAVMLQSAFAEAVAPGGVDPLNGKTLGAGDVLPLASEGSGFAARGGAKLLASSYRPGK